VPCFAPRARIAISFGRRGNATRRDAARRDAARRDGPRDTPAFYFTYARDYRAPSPMRRTRDEFRATRASSIEIFVPKTSKFSKRPGQLRVAFHLRAFADIVSAHRPDLENEKGRRAKTGGKRRVKRRGHSLFRRIANEHLQSSNEIHAPDRRSTTTTIAASTSTSSTC